MRSSMISLVSICVFVLAISLVTGAFGEQELIVSAASSLTDAFSEIGKSFEKANPGTKVVLNFAASGVLLQQVEKGAPVDVFASADQKTMDQAMEKNLIIPDTRQNFAGNELVLILPQGPKKQVKSLEDLRMKEFQKITLGNPESVPAGRYTLEVLTNDGLWEELKPRFIFGESVRQVLDYVRRGEVDAGFVFATDAAVAKDSVKVALEARKHKPIKYPIAVVGSTKNKDLAKRFVQFVLSPEAQGTLSKYGFNKP